jgi:hypothetical protein
MKGFTRVATMTAGETTFTDGSIRTVYRGIDGRQFVLDDAGQAVFDVWIYPGDGDAEEPEGAPIPDHIIRISLTVLLALLLAFPPSLATPRRQSPTPWCASTTSPR